MKIHLTDQQKNLSKHLSALEKTRVSRYDKNRLNRQIHTIEIDTPHALPRLDLDFLFDYQIFPRRIMTYLSQWEVENRKMRVADTIVQQVKIPPAGNLSQKLIFGARIREIIDLPHKKGFSYETLEGHAEKGIATFTVEQHETRLIFKIESCSDPGNLLAKILNPVITKPYQKYCTRAAPAEVKRRLENN